MGSIMATWAVPCASVSSCTAQLHSAISPELSLGLKAQEIELLSDRTLFAGRCTAMCEGPVSHAMPPLPLAVLCKGVIH